MTDIKVAQLSIYPVKSAKGIALSKMKIGDKGPDADRRWMVVNDKLRFVTQRQYPQMCLINVDLAGNVLTLSAAGYPACQVITRSNAGSIEVSVWNDTALASDCGDQAAEWLSGFLGAKVRLVYMPDETNRRVDSAYANNDETVSFADGFPLLLISQASLDLLNSKLGCDVEMNRFRPNIVVDGCEPHAEDDWHKIDIGGLKLSLVKPCSRCIIPSIDPENAIKQPEILQILREYRRQNGKIYFGQNALSAETGEISLGDKVTLIS